MLDNITGKKSVAKLTAEALSAFEAAGVKMNTAIDSIESERVLLESSKTDLEVKIIECTQANDRLTRIKQRIEDFMS